MKKSAFIFSAFKIPLDFLMVLLAGIAAYFLRFTPLFTNIKPILFELPFDEFFSLLILGALFNLMVFTLAGLYQTRYLRGIEEFFRVIVAAGASFLVVNLASYLSQLWFESRFIFIMTWALGALFIACGRAILRRIQSLILIKYKLGLNRVVLIGNETTTQKIKQYIKRHPYLGYRIVKIFRRPELAKLEKEVSRDAIDDIILGDANLPRRNIIELFNFCSEKAINFRFVPTNFQALTTGLAAENLGGILLLEIKKTPLEGWQRVLKRCFDLVFGTIFLTLSFPLFLIVPSMIKFDSEGSVFARVRHRVGLGGKTFFMYKFRSMIKNADQMKEKLVALNERESGKGPLFKLKNDPRITKVGKILRKYRLDEFPQLINVIKGNMSLVGPRAHEIEEVARYKNHQKVVLAIKPGVTGLAQTSGSSDLPFEEENKLDNYYIEHWSLWLDIKILIKTFIFVFMDRSAC